VADLSIQSIDKDSQSTGGMNRIEVKHQFDPIGGINLNWQTAIGWTDQVEYSDDLVTWFADLPGSTFENLASPTGITFSQPKDPDEAYRFYRVRRTKTP
jgi:hypothetical protein